MLLTDPDVQGCTFVVSSFMEYFVNRSKVILLLVEAIGECLLFIIYQCHHCVCLLLEMKRSEFVHSGRWHPSLVTEVKAFVCYF